MGDCVYCQTPAGFLRWSHKECKISFREGVVAIGGVVADPALDAAEAQAAIDGLASVHRVHGKRFAKTLRNAWRGTVTHQLSENGLSVAEEDRLDALLARYDKSRDDVDGRGTLAKRVRAQRDAALVADIRALMHEAMGAGAGRLVEIEARMETVARETRAGEDDLREALVEAVEGEIDKALDDQLLTEQEEQSIVAVTEHFELDPVDLNDNGAWDRMTKARVLRDLSEGKVPDQSVFGRNLPFRLQKTEKLLWVFEGVDYSTTTTRREIRGRSAGASVRVAKGLYFRVGGFKGRPVTYEENTHIDTGLFGVTTRHIYFAGDVKSFRVRHDRIVTITPYTNGVGVMRDGVRARPETFELDDGWFAYNLLQNIPVD